LAMLMMKVTESNVQYPQFVYYIIIFCIISFHD